MGFYSRVIFPHLCDFLLGRPPVARHRRELLASASGHVLEIGFGTGLNLPHYPAQVHKITAIEPNSGMSHLARRRIRQARIPVEQCALRGEQLPFEADTFDCVVSTFTLCSIDEVERALDEVYRVLRPGGEFLFLEHGLSPDPGVRKWQRRLNWLEKRLADGCRLDRDIQQLVTSRPFSSIRLSTGYLEEAPRTHGYLYRGVALKGAP
jgi:ubiquinone/menaquinone biosynthesis C-methylase UbiE